MVTTPLAEGVRRCQRVGSLGGAAPERVAAHLWAVAHGMVSLELNGQLPDLGPAEEAYAEALAFAAAPFLAAGPPG